MCHTDYLSTFIFSLFQISDSISIIFSTTLYLRRSSRNWKRAIIFFVWCITPVIKLRCCIVSIKMFMLSIVFKTQYLQVSSLQQKIRICFVLLWSKNCSYDSTDFIFDLPKVIVWVLLTIIYIIYHFIFNYMIQNQLSTATATVVAPIVNDNRK